MPLYSESKIFQSEESNTGKFQIQFSPNGSKGDDEENAEITIVYRKINTNSNVKAGLMVHYVLYLIGKNGEKFEEQGIK